MKTYIQPQISTLKLNAESMLAASDRLLIDESIKVDNALSNGKDAWDSESWGAEDEE